MTEKQKAKLEQEKLRVAGMRAFEQEAAGPYGKGGLICGIDEAGRGPLAGPVAAGAVILPADHEILWLNDSKKLSPKKRDMLYDQIREEALAWAVVMIGPDRIDQINILQADYEAMRLAVQALEPAPSVLLNDAVTIPGLEIPQRPGDPPGTHYQRGRQMPVHRGGQYPGQGHQGQIYGTAGQPLSRIRLREA